MRAKNTRTLFTVDALFRVPVRVCNDISLEHQEPGKRPVGAENLQNVLQGLNHDLNQELLASHKFNLTK